MGPLTPQVRPRVDRIVNFTTFVSRDGLTLQSPYGKPQSTLTTKAYRQLRTLIAGVDDDRGMPAHGDPDFRQRTREYAFDHVEVEQMTGIASAVYVETTS